MTEDQLSPGQRWDVHCYAAHGRFVTELGVPVIELLSPQVGERILDLGCGDGVLTEQLVTMGCQVVGVDASPEMVEAARARGLDARLMDGQALTFEDEFDAVFSNAALHWMQQPDKVIAGVWRALKRGGRFVGEFGGHGNIGSIVAAITAALERREIDSTQLNPWYFPTAEAYRACLQAQGFKVNFITLMPRPTPLPGDIIRWLETFTRAFCAAVPEGERSRFFDEVREQLQPWLCDSEGRWTADYVRLRFTAEKPED